MPFDREQEPGDELENYEDELSSDYQGGEEEEGLGEGKELEEEVSYESGEGVTPGGAPGVPAPAVAPAPAPAPKPSRKPVRKPKPARAPKKPAKRPGKPAKKVAKPAKRAKKKAAGKKKGRRR